jgi:hypothetical protein
MNYEENMADLNAINYLELKLRFYLRGNCYSILLSKMYYLILKNNARLCRRNKSLMKSIKARFVINEFRQIQWINYRM